MHWHMHILPTTIIYPAMTHQPKGDFSYNEFELIGIDEKISLFMDIYRVGNVYGDTAVIYPMLDTLVKIHYNEAKAWAMYADFLNSKSEEDEALMMWKNHWNMIKASMQYGI